MSAFFSCGTEEEALIKNPTQIDQYFPISDFINQQISRLDGYAVKKTVVMNGEGHEVDQVLFERDWREEFDWFIQSDINKASLAQSYETEKTEHVTRHILKPGEIGVLKQMEVLYENGEVKEINFTTSKENTFYCSNSYSRITTGNDGLIDSYSLESNQKVWFLSPNEMKVNSQVIPK